MTASKDISLQICVRDSSHVQTVCPAYCLIDPSIQYERLATEMNSRIKMKPSVKTSPNLGLLCVCVCVCVHAIKRTTLYKWFTYTSGMHAIKRATLYTRFTYTSGMHAIKRTTLYTRFAYTSGMHVKTFWKFGPKNFRFSFLTSWQFCHYQH